MKKIIIKNAVIVDASHTADSHTNIYIENGIIKEIGSGISEKGCNIIDVEGAYISPGWIDAHTHVDWETGHTSLDPTITYPCDGITLAVDAGTDGPENYEGIHEKILTSPIRIKTYLNIAKYGISSSGGELTSPELLDENRFCKVYEKYREEIIGVKIRIDPRVNNDILGSLERSKKLADRLGLPLIIHPSRCKEPLEKILSFLTNGDVFAHSYSFLEPCILDASGKIKKCVLEARNRGVWFDLSHGSSNFSFDIASRAMEQDFVVDVISTDLHTMNLSSPVRCISDVMSKMMYLGMSLTDIIRRVTKTPSAMLNVEKDCSIHIGMNADMTIFKVEKGLYTLEDSCNNKIQTDKRINVIGTILGEDFYPPRKCIFYKGPEDTADSRDYKALRF